MNNIGLEVVFWTALSIYLLAKLGVFKKKAQEFHKKLQSLEQSYQNELKIIKNDHRKKENEWMEQRSNYEGFIKQISLKFDQSMEFIEIVRVEEKNIASQFDQKIKHFFNAAYQNLNVTQQRRAQISIEETR